MKQLIAVAVLVSVFLSGCGGGSPTKPDANANPEKVNTPGKGSSGGPSAPPAPPPPPPINK
jgi:hypothetical protein